jgi:hypothetical protein
LKKGLLIPLAALFLFIGCDNSKRVTFLTAPTGGEAQRQLDLDAYARKYEGFDGVYLNHDVVFEHVTSQVLNSVKWSFFETWKRSYVVLNPDAENLSTFAAKVPSGRALEQAYLSVTSPTGQVQRFTKDDLKAEAGPKGAMTYRLAYPNVKKGSIVREEFVIACDNAYDDFPITHDVPLQFDIPAERVSFKYLYPSWWRIQVKEVQAGKTPATLTTTDEDAKKATLSYKAEDVPAVMKEPYAPFFKEVANYVALRVTHLSLGRAYYDAPADWNAFAKRFANYAIDREPKVSGRVANTAADLTRACKTDQEKLEAVIRFVQTEIKPGAHLDGNFADMLIKKTGNLYQVTGLAKSLLAKAGIENRFLLIHSAEDGYFDRRFITNDEIYIPALQATVDKRTFVVFPYIPNLPIDYVPEPYQGQAALAIEDQYRSELTTFPKDDSSQKATEENYDLELLEDGRIHVKEQKVFRGAMAYGVRQGLEHLTPEETDKALKRLLTYSEGKVDLEKRDIQDLGDYKKPLVINLEYTIDNLLTVTPEEVVFNTAGLFAPSSRLKMKVDPKERQNPIVIHYDEETDKRITLRFPKKWALTTPLKDLSVETIFGKTEARYALSGSTLTVAQSLSLKKAFEPKEKLDDLLSITGKRSRLYIPSLVFKVGS